MANTVADTSGRLRAYLSQSGNLGPLDGWCHDGTPRLLAARRPHGARARPTRVTAPLVRRLESTIALAAYVRALLGIWHSRRVCNVRFVAGANRRLSAHYLQSTALAPVLSMPRYRSGQHDICSPAPIVRCKDRLGGPIESVPISLVRKAVAGMSASLFDR